MPERTTPPGVVLAADVGGTQIKLGLVRGGRLLARMEMAAEPGRGLAWALHQIAKAVEPLCRQAGLAQKRVTGLGLAFPGIIEPGTERILSTPAGKFDDAPSLQVGERVGRLLGLRTVVCNDANAALAAEWRWGAARGCRSAVMMTLGTGIGTSAIIDGVPLRGQHGQAGCLGGHLLANVVGRTCLCGNVGCAEAEASTWALPAQAQAHPEFGASRLGREKTLDYAAVFRLAGGGDAVALELRERALRVWAGALVSLIHAYDPERAIIGGGIMRSGTLILPRLRRYVGRHAWTAWGKVKVLPAMLKNDAGLLGVASLCADRLCNP